MAFPISSIPLGIHTQTPPSLLEQIKNCFDPITQCVIKIFKQIGDFFYHLFYTDLKTKPVQVVNALSMDRGDPKNIIAFYKNEEPNVDGLTLDEILHADDNFLEQNHAWVQWAFPLEKPSAFNPTAPILNPASIAEIRKDQIIKGNFFRAVDRVLSFYGLHRNPEGKIERAPHFAQASKNWLNAGNHNFLRITRIIHSSKLMLNPALGTSKELFNIMEDIYLNEGKGIITEPTYQIWKNAV